jgi:plastocyanin
MLRPIASLLAASALLVFASTGVAASPKLVGTTGPGFSIKVTMNGKALKTLKAGTYSLAVNDKASIHDFHLMGPGINKVVTSVGFVGTKTITVSLKKGTYRYQCDPHASSGMKGSFTVS